MGYIKKMMYDREQYNKKSYPRRTEQELKKIREERLLREQQLKDHINVCKSIKTISLIPIKKAIEIYREKTGIYHIPGRTIGVSDNCVKRNFQYIKDLIELQKIKNRWYCSEEKINYLDFQNFDITNDIGHILYIK